MSKWLTVTRFGAAAIVLIVAGWAIGGILSDIRPPSSPLQVLSTQGIYCRPVLLREAVEEEVQ
jgi:hypothetical protein